MAVGVNKMQVLSIYKSLIRDSQKFCAYNFRLYALRRIRDAFRENKNVTDPKEVKRLMDVAKENLEIIRRQVTVGNMYKTEKLVIEPKN